MQNQKQYQNFQEQNECTGVPLPIGQPIQLQMQPPHFQQPCSQQSPAIYPHQNTFQNFPPPPQYQIQAFNVNQPYPSPLVLPQQNSKLYDFPMSVRCQCCKQNVQTLVSEESGNIAHIWAVAICCIWGQCCCLPYLLDACLDKVHYCPNCGQGIIRKHARCFDFIN